MTGIELNRLICKIINIKINLDNRLNYFTLPPGGGSAGEIYEFIEFCRDSIDELYNIVTNENKEDKNG